MGVIGSNSKPELSRAAMSYAPLGAPRAAGAPESAPSTPFLYRVNFLYFNRLGSSASGPRRRFLSSS